MNHSLVFFPLIVMELNLRPIGRNHVVVQLEPFFFRQEYDGLVYQFELRLNLAHLLLGCVATPDGPVKKPAQIEIMLLNGVFLHLSIDSQVTDKGLDTIIVEVIQRLLFDNNFKVLLESIPDLLSTRRKAGEAQSKFHRHLDQH